MSIFAEIVLFALFVFGVIDYIRVKVTNKLLRAENNKLTQQNAELLELVTASEVDRIGVPPVGKHILHG